MQRSGISRLFLTSLAPAIALALPLSLTGCDSGMKEGEVAAPKDFKETHKDSFAEFEKQKSAAKKR